MNIIEQISEKIVELREQNKVPSKIILGKKDLQDFKASLPLMYQSGKRSGFCMAGIPVYQHSDDRYVEVI